MTIIQGHFEDTRTDEFMTLSDLKPGQRATISTIDTSDPGVRRLMVLGMIEGTAFEFSNVALGGDPLEIQFDGVAVSLRREQASKFTVSPDEMR
jgi:ferrous iron transport protein A